MKKKRFDEDIWLISKTYTGSNCDLYLAFWPEEDEQVIIKTVRADLNDDDKRKVEERLLKEAATLEEFWNSGFPKVYDIRRKQDTNSLYLILEHFDGNSLRDYLSLHHEKGLNKNFIENFIKQMQHLLIYLHNKKNICHLDLTPENIIVDTSNNIHLIDFEESQVVGQQVYEQKVRGKKNYLPPEYLDINSNIIYNGSADIYALGIVLKEVLEKTPGLKRTSKKKYNNIIRQCLSRRAEARPTAQTLMQVEQKGFLREIQFNLQELFSNKFALTILSCCLFLIIFTLYPTKSHKKIAPQKSIKRQRKTNTIKPKPKPKPLPPKAKKAIKKKSKSIKKVKKIKKKPLTYKKKLSYAFQRSKKASQKCVARYAPNKSFYRYNITISRATGKVVSFVPLGKPPRRLTYCLSQAYDNASFPKRTSKGKNLIFTESFKK